MEDYERVLLVKSDVFIYKIPPRTSNRAYRAADWKLDAPDWSGRLRLVAKGKECILKLEDKLSGELFGKCPVDKYPGIAVEAVSDSSRYFVIRLQDDNGRNAYIGIGFSDRGDSFDMNVALQDHFKVLQKEEEIEKDRDTELNQPKLDLGFKDGQTIKVNLNIAKRSGSSSASNRPRTKPLGGGVATGGILLPPPPGVSKTVTSKPASTLGSVQPMTTQSENDFLLDFNSLNIGSTDITNTSSTAKSNSSLTNTNNNDLFGDFESSGGKPSNSKPESDPWAQFQ